MSVLRPGVKALTLPDSLTEKSQWWQTCEVVAGPLFGKPCDNDFPFMLCSIRYDDDRLHHYAGVGDRSQWSYPSRSLMPLPDDDQKRQFETETGDKNARREIA